MLEDTPVLAPVCTLELTFEDPILYPSTTGDRMSYRILQGRAEGPRLSADVADDGGELVVIRPDGTLDLDSRMMLKLADERLVYWRAKGSIVLSPEAARRAAAGAPIENAPFHVSPYFDTPDDELRWMTRAAFIGQGTFSTGGARIALYALGVEAAT